MLIILFFSIVSCQNISQNPSFEEFNSNNQLLSWHLDAGTDLSPVSHTGQNSIHWKPKSKLVYNYQFIKVEKGFQYEVCGYVKLINVPKGGVAFGIEARTRTTGFFEFSYSRGYFGDTDWKKVCYTTEIIKNLNNDSEFFLCIFTLPLPEEGEIFVDDITVRRINLKIAINNDRDEVYDKINVVYQINGNKENYNLSDFDLTTRIKDNNKKYYEKNKIKITSFFFTNSINVKNIGLKDNNFYQVETIIKNKKDNITDISTYTFKKIKKIKRNVTYDEYGRLFLKVNYFSHWEYMDLHNKIIC